MSTKLPARAFKTAWFTKAAKKARIGDAELCVAIQQVMVGQADDLGGGVFKKRLNDKMHRSIVVAKGGRQLRVCVLVREEGPRQHLARRVGGVQEAGRCITRR